MAERVHIIVLMLGVALLFLCSWVFFERPLFSAWVNFSVFMLGMWGAFVCMFLGIHGLMSRGRQ